MLARNDASSRSTTCSRVRTRRFDRNFHRSDECYRWHTAHRFQQTKDVVRLGKWVLADGSKTVLKIPLPSVQLLAIHRAALVGSKVLGQLTAQCPSLLVITAGEIGELSGPLLEQRNEETFELGLGELAIRHHPLFSALRHSL